jgi:hypothetical protein
METHSSLMDTHIFLSRPDKVTTGAQQNLYEGSDPMERE